MPSIGSPYHYYPATSFTVDQWASSVAKAVGAVALFFFGLVLSSVSPLGLLVAAAGLGLGLSEFPHYCTLQTFDRSVGVFTRVIVPQPAPSRPFITASHYSSPAAAYGRHCPPQAHPFSTSAMPERRRHQPPIKR